MGADFGIEMRRHRDTGRAGDGRRAHPSGDAADAHEIRHDIVAGLRAQRPVQIARPVEILADLQGRFEFPGELGAAVEIVVDDRFFQPGEAQIVEHVAPAQGLRHVEALVEIDHQVHVIADRPANRIDRGEVVPWIVPAEAQLQALELSLVTDLDGLGGDFGRRLEPEPVAVVGADRAGRPTEQGAERHAGGLGERVPGRHVDAGDGDHRQAFVADEVQRLSRGLVEFGRRQRPALEHRRQVVQGGHEIVHRLDDVGFKIAAPDDPFLGFEVDQD